MRTIYHIVTRFEWEQAPSGPYRPPSLQNEGFIHCSNTNQVAGVANRFFGREPELLVLCIDAGLLTGPVRDEDGGGGELFPHVHGPIDREAIVGVRPLERVPGQSWIFPEEPRPSST